MITAQVESLTEGLEELKPLLPLHYEELSLHQFHGFPLDPNYGFYLAKDAAGEVLYVTLRKYGKLCGYFLGFLGEDPHYQVYSLSLDIFYVVPEHRGGSGKVLFDVVKNEAMRRGVKAWFVGNKEHSKVHATALFKAMGFDLIEQKYCLWMEN